MVKHNLAEVNELTFFVGLLEADQLNAGGPLPTLMTWVLN